MDFSKEFEVNKKKGFNLSKCDPAYTMHYKDKKKAEDELIADIKLLASMQDKLYAQNVNSVLIIFQALDAAGKDGTIKHVMSGINPQGCIVASFKAPNNTELNHDWLWRNNLVLPAKGMITIFNRSYYEEVLVTKVHPEILENQKLITKKFDKEFWHTRYQHIVNYEDYLADNGIMILKFFLNVSKEEQKKRFLKRIENPEKNWKLSPADTKERNYWDKYQEAYEIAIAYTSTEKNPWYVIPADNKWFTRLLVSKIINERLEQLDLKYPELTEEQKLSLNSIKEQLTNEK